MLCKYIGHKYRARYHRTFPAVHIPAQALGFHGPEHFMDKRYVYDVCERCGSVVKAEGRQ